MDLLDQCLVLGQQWVALGVGVPFAQRLISLFLTLLVKVGCQIVVLQLAE